ncbi:hypothetical protein [Thalassomonas actiniarum]|uniref:EF-hand domain-containing protein n=1 Tax=Thalassomonas actiniarum TaxID=485447 RepID=A0AAE9YVX1_9GAMM|nr:hypothetical protein [Thalassomonas actiniarum]WDE00527.1 hypothetical protein SG35_007795 [Thalassomonas actiniarum]
MFKKTLLALTIAGTASAANAATVYADITDAVVGDLNTLLTVATPAAGDPYGTDGVITGTENNCDAAATTLGVTLDEGAFTNAGADDDSLTFGAAGQDQTRVIMTATNACTILLDAETKDTTPALDGIEYSTATAIELTPDFIVGLGGLKDEDTITLTFSGAKIDTTLTVAPTVTVSGDAGVRDTGTAATFIGTAADMTFDLLDIDPDGEFVRFTVKSADSATTTVAPNAILNVAGIFLDSTGLSSATSVAMSTVAINTSGTEYDPSSAATIVSLTPQYEATVTTAFDALIDVGDDRQGFENSASADALTLNVDKLTTGLELTPEEATYVITGDFSWMLDDSIDTDESGTLTSAEIANAVTYAGDTLKSYAIDTDLTELTVTTTTGAAVTATQVFTFTVPGYDNGAMEHPVINVQDFTVKVDVQDDDAFTTDPVNMSANLITDAGEWDLNGSVIYLPYVPFGPNTQPIIRHTNKGNQTGDLTVRYMVEGVDTSWNALSAANVDDATPGVRNMLTLITDALKDEGYDATTDGFKVALEFVTNVPSEDVFVYGGAKVTAEGQDRIHLGTLKDND